MSSTQESVNFDSGTTILLVDVGGTNSRCALTDGHRIDAIAVFENDPYDNLESLIDTYLKKSARVDAAILGVAGQVIDNEVKLLNRGWHFSAQSISKRTGVPSVRLINDFEAVAYALPHLTLDELKPLDANQASSHATLSDFENTMKPCAVLGCGTGLGVSSVVWTGSRWLALPGEGGHVTLAATTTQEVEFCAFLRERFGHASAERALCGPGLTNIHQFLHRDESAGPREISARAAAGDAQALETFTLFFELLGCVAGNLALTVGATRGVYVAGGVITKNLNLLAKDGRPSELALKFRQRFEQKGRYSAFLQKLPVYWVTEQIPAFHGLAYLARLEAELEKCDRIQ